MEGAIYTSEDVPSSVHENVGLHLSSNSGIVQKILSYMGARDLNRCARVCKLWSEISESIKKIRYDILWMFQATVYPFTDPSEISNDDEHCTEDKIFMSDARCPDCLGDHFYEMVERFRAQPQHGIMFCSNQVLYKARRFFCGYEDIDLDDDSDEEEEENKSKREDNLPTVKDFYYNDPFLQFLSKELPANCRMICCGTSGVIGTPMDNSVPCEVKMLNGFSACMLPSIPGLQVHQFSVAEKKKLRKQKKFDESELAQLTGIPDDIDVKAMIVFCEEYPRREGLMKAIVEQQMEKRGQKIAIGGAVVENVLAAVRNKDDWPMVAGLVFAGDTLKVASYVIQPNVRTVKELENDLKSFKSGITLATKSIAFMFANCNKGGTFYGEANAEPQMFRKVFPDTLLVGCFSNGEIGVSYLPEAQQSQSKPDGLPKWLHFYTTVLVVLSW